MLENQKPQRNEIENKRPIKRALEVPRRGCRKGFALAGVSLLELGEEPSITRGWTDVSFVIVFNSVTKGLKGYWVCDKHCSSDNGHQYL